MADPRLKPGDRDLVAWLLGQAWNAPYVQVANQDIMDGLEIGRRTVQDRLERCKRAGWLACEEDAHHRSGRRIVFVWRCENGRTPHADNVAHPMRDAAPPMRIPAHPGAEFRTPPCDTPHTPVRNSARPSYKTGIEEDWKEEEQQEAGSVVVVPGLDLRLDGHVPAGDWYEMDWPLDACPDDILRLNELDEDGEPIELYAPEHRPDPRRVLHLTADDL